jgi:hypothetical protein
MKAAVVRAVVPVAGVIPGPERGEARAVGSGERLIYLGWRPQLRAAAGVAS